MNSSSDSYLSTIVVPTRCSDASHGVSAFLKCLASRSMSNAGIPTKHMLVARHVSELNEVSVHLRNDIGMTQGQFMAAQLTSVLDEEKSS